jgi:hypothetical protein
MPTVKRGRGCSRASSSKHSGDHAGGELLRRQAVAAADDVAPADAVGVVQRRHDVEEQRLADRAGLLRAVQHRDAPRGGRQRLHERPRGEGAVDAHLDDPDALPALVEGGHGLRRGLGARAHDDHHPLDLRVPGVVDDLHAPAVRSPSRAIAPCTTSGVRA